MSSDKQETSIDDQRAELIEYAAKRGYNIVTWYADEGISGWKNKHRQGFRRLIADATEGAFRAVPCWDQSHFSRFDPMEANYFWHQLRQAGVTLETIKEGKLDFESLGAGGCQHPCSNTPKLNTAARYRQARSTARNPTWQLRKVLTRRTGGR